MNPGFLLRFGGAVEIKLDQKILGFALAFGLMACVVDAAVDAWLFYEGPFWDLLLFDVPPMEIYVRVFILLTFLLFGGVVSFFVEQRRAAEAGVEHLNRVLRASRDVTQLVAHEKDRDRLLSVACQLLVGTRGYYNAWIGLLDHGRPVEPIFHAGFSDEFEVMAEGLRAGELPSCATRCLEREAVEVRLHPPEDCDVCPFAPKYPDRAGMAAPIRHADVVYGWITVSLPRSHADSEEEKELLAEVASDLGLALWSIGAEARAQKEAAAAREALERSETRFREMAELLPEAVFEADLNADLTYVNRRALDLLGYTEEDFRRGVNGIEVLAPEDRARAREHLRKRFLGEDPGVTEYRARKKDGTTIPILFHAATIHEEGELVGLRGVIVDMSAQKAAEEELLLTTRRMANMVDSSPVGVFLYQLDDRERLILVGSNPAASRLLDQDITVLVGKPLEEAFPGLTGTEIPARYREAAALGRPWHAPRLAYDADGIKGVFEVVAFQTSPGEMAVQFLDVTRREATEAALRESEQKLRGVIEQSNDAIYILYERRFDLVNRRFCELTGVTPEEAAAPDFDFMELVAPGSVPLLREREERRAAGKAVPSVYSFDIRRRDGQVVHVEASVTTIDYRGDTAILGTLRDVTEQRKMEVQLNRSRKMESIGRLSGGIAHDLNNLLTPIIGFGEILLNDIPEGEENRELADEIVQAAFRARDLVRQLLAFSRRQTLEVRPLDLNQMLGSFEGLLRRTLPENIRFEIRRASNLPMIAGDRGQLEQVVMNLILNARDAMPEGGDLVLETDTVHLDEAASAAYAETDPGQFVRLTVTDGGVGMDAETQGRVFEPFFTTKPKGRGTGLGLATVYGIVKQHRGAISVLSEVGTGSVFQCLFPVTEALSEEPSSPGETAAVEVSGTETVMVVEDEEAVRSLASGVLARKGYEVFAAADGTECLRILEGGDIDLDLLLTDVVLPGMNGRDLFAHVAKRFPDAKVIYMSGYSEEVVSHEGILAEGIEFIQKPFSIHAFLEKVRRVLDHRSAPSTPE